MPFSSDFLLQPPGRMTGHVLHRAEPDRRWHVGLFQNDSLLGCSLADLPLPPDGDRPRDCGFAFELMTEDLIADDRIRLEVLNTGHVIARLTGAALQAAAQQPTSIGSARPGNIRQLQGLTLTGQIGNGVTHAPGYEILALEGDRIVGRSRLWRWQHIETPGNPMGRTIAFDLLLDPALADGRPHRIHVQTSAGQALEGSPLDILALPDPVRDQLLAGARSGRSKAAGRMADATLERFFGTAMPLSAYAALYPELDQTLAHDPSAPLGQDGQWRPIGQTGWVLCHHNDLLPCAEIMARLTQTLSQIPTCEETVPPSLILTDLAVRQDDNLLMPLLFPAFDLERLLEQGHAALCFAMPQSALDPAASSLIDQLLSLVLHTSGTLSRAHILHLPHPGGIITQAALMASQPARQAALSMALHRRIGLNPVLPAGTRLQPSPAPRGQAASFPALRLQRPTGEIAISVIIPTRNHGALLERAVSSLIEGNPGIALDLIIADNGTDEPASLASLDRLAQTGASILNLPGGFNFSRLNNLASQHARHELLCFMNNDVEFPAPDLLGELAGRMADPGVGAAGPLMTRASDIIQHGGVVLGPHHVAAHAFEDRMFGDRGPAEMLRVAHETSALTAALLLTRRSLFRQLGGFDEEMFAVNFNDVDYCLRLAQLGFRLVFSPHVRLLHLESASRGRERDTPAGRRLDREVANLRAKWREVLLDDPQYHPLLAPDLLPWRGLTLKHRAPGARSAAARPPLALPAWL